MHLNRIMDLYMAPVRLGTPTQGMEVIYNLMPLDIYLKGEGLKSYIQTKKFKYVKWDGKSPTRQERGHRSLWESLVQDSGMLNQPADQIVSKRIMDKKY